MIRLSRNQPMLYVHQRNAPASRRDSIRLTILGASLSLMLLAGCGVNAVLVGEAVVTSDDVAGKGRELAGQAVSPAKP